MAKINIAGNVVADPKMIQTKGGNTLVTFSIAESHSYVDRSTGEWVHTEPVFWRCEAWGQLGEHVADSCIKGSRVMAEGVYFNRAYTDEKSGEQRITGTLKVCDLGLSVRYETAHHQGRAGAA